MVKPRTPQPRINQVTLSGCRSLANRTANALRHIDALRQTGMTVRNSVTLGASVALADLDLSTLEGGRIALQRLDTIARHLRGELARRQDLSYQPSCAACVHDTLGGALAQADALAAPGTRGLHGVTRPRQSSPVS
jgi:hypothetical protein